MKRFLLGFVLIVSVLTAGMIIAPQNQAAAFTCNDGSIHTNPPRNLPDQDKQAIYESTCNGDRGGLRSVSDTPGAPQGCVVNRFFLGFPRWYEYLETQQYTDPVTGEVVCQPRLNGIADVWLVVAAVIEILLRIASLAAVAFIVVGGVSYVTSQGEPDKTRTALHTIINALIGLAIAIAATAIVTFIAGRFN